MKGMVRSLALGVLIALVPVAPLEAQGVGGSRVSLTVSGGVFLPSAGGDLLPFFEEKLTFAGGDLRGSALGLEVGVSVFSPRFEVVGGVEAGRGTEVASQVREYAGAPVRQNTQLTLGPTLYLGAKLHLLPTASRGSLFLTAGGGSVLRYELRQWGQFYDEVSTEVFADDFLSKGRVPYGFAGVGAGLRLGGSAALTAQVRYQVGEATPQGDFQEFDRIDLSGLKLSTGISYLP